MQVEIPTPLRTERVPPGEQVSTPWLTGRGPRRRVTENWWIRLGDDWYLVPKGYVFNGASIPWWLWWLFPPSYSPAWEASAFHDWCYSHLWKILPKTFADEAFEAIMLHSGARPIVARAFHWAVSRFGKGGWADAA